MAQSAKRALKARRQDLEARAPDDVTRKELHEVLKALERIEAGTWGRCEQCSGAIGRDRLRALPETRTCIDCAR